uniref:Uncharacterized protein n=1 Tax=Sitepeofons virus TaxID=3072220 RepID=A0AA96NLE1_9VIRU|nr:MAG: hypothetical protein [Sitepeofons virus]
MNHLDLSDKPRRVEYWQLSNNNAAKGGATHQTGNKNQNQSTVQTGDQKPQTQSQSTTSTTNNNNSSKTGGKRSQRNRNRGNAKATAIAESQTDEAQKQKAELDAAKSKLQELKDQIADMQRPEVALMAEYKAKRDLINEEQKLYAVENLEHEVDPMAENSERASYPSSHLRTTTIRNRRGGAKLGPRDIDVCPVAFPKYISTRGETDRVSEKFLDLTDQPSGFCFKLSFILSFMFQFTQLAKIAKVYPSQIIFDSWATAFDVWCFVEDMIKFFWVDVFMKIWLLIFLQGCFFLGIIMILRFIILWRSGSCYKQITGARLVYLHRRTHKIRLDARPEMFRSEKFKSSTVSEYEPAFMVSFGIADEDAIKQTVGWMAKLFYTDAMIWPQRSDFAIVRRFDGDFPLYAASLPAHLQTENSPVELKNQYITTDLLPTLLNQKTLVVRDQKTAVERALRLCEANGHYSEDYRLLFQGNSSMRDTSFLAAAIIRQSVETDPRDFH